jgi:small subunit ribosomal protein S6
MQKTYELMVLLHPDLEIDAEAPIVKVEGLVEAAGGRVTKRDNWGKKRLAYRIARQDFAIYVYFEILLDPANVRQVEEQVLITEEVLRHLLVVHEEPAPRRDAKKSVEKNTDAAIDEKADDEKADDAKTEVVTAEEGTK